MWLTFFTLVYEGARWHQESRTQRQFQNSLLAVEGYRKALYNPYTPPNAWNQNLPALEPLLRKRFYQGRLTHDELHLVKQAILACQRYQRQNCGARGLWLLKCTLAGLIILAMRQGFFAPTSYSVDSLGFLTDLATAALLLSFFLLMELWQPSHWLMAQDGVSWLACALGDPSQSSGEFVRLFRAEEQRCRHEGLSFRGQSQLLLTEQMRELDHRCQLSLEKREVFRPLLELGLSGAIFFLGLSPALSELLGDLHTL